MSTAGLRSAARHHAYEGDAVTRSDFAAHDADIGRTTELIQARRGEIDEAKAECVSPPTG